MEREQLEHDIKRYFGKLVQKDKGIRNGYLLVHSDKRDIHVNLAEGDSGEGDSGSPHPQQPYYIASVSKLLTAVLVAMLEEQGLLGYEDPIAEYLDEELLSGLHNYRGRDYTGEIRVKHLLNHTSGLHCLVEDRPKQGKRLIDLVLEQPEKAWTPREAILWAKQHLQARSEPGKGFHYSDTGYHLLGFIIERVTGLPLHAALRGYLFEPLGMKHSWLIGAEPIVQPEYPLAELLAGDSNIAHYTSLGFMYAGGGIISTNEDLLLFMRALVRHQLVSEDSLARMKQEGRTFFIGIDYFYGIMAFKPVPLFMPSKYKMWGNAGSTGSFLFYHPASESFLIGSLNHFRYNRKGIRLIMIVINKLMKGI